MPRPPTTWLQVTGYRFLLRRLEAALLTGDATAGARVRRQSAPLAIGCLLAGVAAAGWAVLAVLRPHPALEREQLVMARESGALFVRVGDTWHPVPNLASARLIAGAAVHPRPVREADLVRTRRGPMLGIPGAPQFLGAPLLPDESVWTMCDADGVTTVVAGPVTRSSALNPGRAVLVAPASGSPAYLLYDGRRAVVDLADTAVVRALRLEGRAPRPVSQSLLDAVPEAPSIAAPAVREAGRPVARLPGFAVGDVLRVARGDGDEYYAVLPGGVQRIGRVAADILRFSDSRGAATAIAVAPDALRAVPIVDSLPVATFPDLPPATADEGGVVCASWYGSGVALLAGGEPPVPPGRAPVALAQADGPGAALDAVYLPPGRGAYVRAGGARYFVADTGVRFAVRDDEAAGDLGLPAPVAAPWPVLAVLPSGPELSRQGASVARDAVAGPP